MKTPNLIVILSDQHSPHVGGYAGDTYARTPNLDRLARQGAMLENNYCPTPLCVPSRMAWLTGQYPRDLRIWTNAGQLSSAVPTFAHQLARANYETVLCGRMHFIGADQLHGFESRLVGDVSGAMTGMPASGMFEGVWDRAGCGQSAAALEPAACGPGQATYELYDRDVTSRAEAFLEQQRENGERPFCLVVGYLLPHNPYVCSPERFARYLEVLPELETTPPPNEHPALRELRASRALTGVDPENARRARAAYYGLVETLDDNVGRILAALERSGKAGETHVVYTSDHGEMNGEHGMWAKSCFYEGASAVPCLWRGPGIIPGTQISAVTSLLDLTSTLLDLAGADPLPAARGCSLRNLLLTGQDSSWTNRAFVESCPFGLRPSRMLREGPWKLALYHGYEQAQLFNLENDPEEQHDLGNDPAFADIRQHLEMQILENWDADWIEKNLEGERLVRNRRNYGTPKTSEKWDFPVGGNQRGGEI